MAETLSYAEEISQIASYLAVSGWLRLDKQIVLLCDTDAKWGVYGRVGIICVNALIAPPVIQGCIGLFCDNQLEHLPMIPIAPEPAIAHIIDSMEDAFHDGHVMFAFERTDERPTTMRVMPRTENNQS